MCYNDDGGNPNDYEDDKDLNSPHPRKIASQSFCQKIPPVLGRVADKEWPVQNYQICSFFPLMIRIHKETELMNPSA